MKKFNLVLFFMLMSIGWMIAQTKVSGIVISADDGEPIIGASVVVAGTTVGIVTDIDGKFTLEVPKNATQLKVTYVGMKPIEVGIKPNLRIVMHSDTKNLDEVVVVGYGTQKKKDVTSSISKVKGDDLSNLATASFDSQLAGRASGVQVIQPSGVLGSVPEFRVRGVTSLSSSTQPLIVVDGMPVVSGDVSMGYVKSNAMADINPNDIASVEILKDGAATAIYGSRGANGVVLITTKKGKKGSASLSYDGYIGVASASKKHKLLNGEQFTTIANELFTYYGEEGQAVYDGTNTDWNDYIYRNGFQQSHTINANGGTDKSQYYVSLGYTNQKGIIRANDLERFSIKADLTHEVNKWIKLGIATNTAKSTINGIVEGGSSLGDASFAGIRMLPNVSVYNPEDITGYNIDAVNRKALGRGANKTYIDNGIQNIVWALDNNVNRSTTLRSISNIFGEFDIVKGLKFKTQAGLDIALVENYMVWDAASGDGYGYGGLIDAVNTNYTNWNWQNVLTYDVSFSELHNLNLTAVQEYTRSQYHYTDGTVKQISDPFFTDHIITGTYGQQEVSGGKSFNGLASYLGRANYNYDSKYYLGGSIRRDGLSKLPKKNRWGTFWGVSGAWRISRERFWMDSSINEWFNDLRIRGSYATLGNQNIKGNFPYLGSYGAQKYGSLNAIIWNNMGNQNLKWESTKTFDIGVDASMFNNRLNVELAYWSKETKDLVLDVPTSPSLGVPNNKYTQNIGAISNRGFELSISGAIFQSKDFSWNADLNFSTLRNRVKALVNGTDVVGAYTIVREGESMNAIYGYEFAGVNNANGNAMWYKADGSIVQFDLANYNYYLYNPENLADLSQSSSLSASTDRKVLGDAIPKWFGGFNNTILFKGFDVNVFFRFSGGNKIMNATRQDLLNTEFANKGVEILGRWQSPENPGNGYVPQIGYGDGQYLFNERFSDSRFVENGAFLKLSNLSIGYTIPNHLVAKAGISRFRIYAQGQNLFTISKYKGLDPELTTDLTSSSSFVGGFGVDWNAKAQQRVFTFGVNLTF